MQRWSPRGHILKSLALKVKSLALASWPQVLENWPVLGSRTALFFELLKFCGALVKFFGKIFVKTFFFLESTCACVLGPWPWPRAFLSLASRVSALGKAVLGLRLGFFCVLGLGLEPCVLDSTSANMVFFFSENKRTHQQASFECFDSVFILCLLACCLKVTTIEQLLEH